MDHFQAKSIPDYRFLQDWKPNKDDSYRPNFKYDLQKFLRRGEYDNFVKPLIQSKRPEFIYSKGSGKKHRVDEFVAVYSNGEKIVYNTFKMNGIILIFEPKQFQFEYEIDGETKTKRPDFYWEENKEIIEVSLILILTCLGLLPLAGWFRVTSRLSKSKSLTLRFIASIGLKAVSFKSCNKVPY